MLTRSFLALFLATLIGLAGGVRYGEPERMELDVSAGDYLEPPRRKWAKLVSRVGWLCFRR
jgi:hypothetical protein